MLAGWDGAFDLNPALAANIVQGGANLLEIHVALSPSKEPFFFAWNSQMRLPSLRISLEMS
jgi:hypothetical protein